MSGSPKTRSMIVPSESESRPVLVSAVNKAKVSPLSQKPASKVKKEEEKVKNGTNQESLALMSSLSAPSRILKRQDILLRSNFSMNASCSSDASTDSFCSRASTGRIGRVNYAARKKQGVGKMGRIVSKMEKVVSDGEAKESIFPDFWQGKRRCAWVTLNTDPCYAAFHDEEWGVPVHDDKKLFELLVLSGALAELAWPSILGKRHIFREVFMDFDPVAVSKLNEKKIIASGSAANSLLSEPKLRGIIENARHMLKIIEEFGSFDKYCWTFVNHKPITNKFRYARQIPVKTPKADMISKDLVRRGFRSVGPTVIYTFMQVAGLTNDHLIGCFRFDECAAAAAAAAAVTSSCSSNSNSNNQLCASVEKRQEDRINDIDLDLSCLTIS